MNKESKERAIQRIKELAVLLKGTVDELVTSNSLGDSSKKIVIEYDHESK